MVKRGSLFSYWPLVAVLLVACLIAPAQALALTAGEADELNTVQVASVEAPETLPVPKIAKIKNSSMYEGTNQWVSNGTYVIQTATGKENKIISAYATNYALKMVNNAINGRYQRWHFSYNHISKTYTITNTGNGKVLTYVPKEVRATFTKLGKKVQNTQKWVLLSTTKGYALRPACNGKVALSVQPNGLVKLQYVSTAGDNQFFRLYSAAKYRSTSTIKDGVYNLYNVKSLSMLQMQKETLLQGTRLNVADDNGSIVQKFRITRAGNYYRIYSIISDMYVAGSEGSTVYLAKVSASASQKWIACRQSNGAIVFVNAATKKVLGANSGGNACVSKGKGSNNAVAAQQWMLLPTESGLNYYQTICLSKANNPRPSNVSRTNMFVTIDKTAHHLIIWQRDNKQGIWHILRDWKCSSTKWGWPYDHNYYMRMPKSRIRTRHVMEDTGYCYTAHWYSSLGNGTFIHSIMFRYHSNALKDARLGYSISGGCTRLSVPNAKWVYYNVPFYTGYANFDEHRH